MKARPLPASGGANYAERKKHAILILFQGMHSNKTSVCYEADPKIELCMLKLSRERKDA
jgi:hypothetical protein